MKAIGLLNKVVIISIDGVDLPHGLWYHNSLRIESILKVHMECFHCGKRALYGRSHTHHRGVAGGRWKKRAQKTQRIFKVNLQSVVALVNGKNKRVTLCMKCLNVRKIYRWKRPFITLVHPPVIEVKPTGSQPLTA
jgi:ribosomal protein L28